jgi:hypothetical protein
METLLFFGITKDLCEPLLQFFVRVLLVVSSTNLLEADSSLPASMIS